MRQPTFPPSAPSDQVEPADGAMVVRFPDEVDIACAADLRERMLILLNRGIVLLVADLSATTFCDCAGLNALLRARTRAAALGTPFGMLIPDIGPVCKIFHVSGVSEAIPHAPTLERLLPLLHATPRPSGVGR